MRKPVIWAAMVVLVLGGSRLVVAEKFDAEATCKEIAPFVGAETVLIYHGDLRRVDANAVAEWFAPKLKAAMPDGAVGEQQAQAMKRDLAKAQEVFAAFKKAGAGDIWGMMAMGKHGRQDEVIIIPLPGGADAVAVEAAAKKIAMRSPEDDPNAPWVKQVARVKDAVVVARKTAMERLAAQKPVDRPEIKAALEASGEGDFRLVFVPTPKLREQLAEDFERMPEEMGGHQIKPALDAARWVVFSGTMPPKLTLRLVVHSDAEGAALLKRMADDALGAFKNPKLIEMVAPKVEGGRLTIALDAAQTEKLIDGLMPALARARQAAMRVHVGAQIRRLWQAAIAYWSVNQKWPEDFAAMEKNLDGPQGAKMALLNPRQPNRPVGFVYVKPQGQGQPNAQTVVIYEAYDKWGEGINVGYGDGRVEFVADEAEFIKQLEASMKR